mmetsp:Transcript_95115/g.205346  ORF Transcript_95115/g.205346 Transcript_95115/m.205346 type:complete len:98 (-) Transcript_95115:566-859(-)
MMCGYPPFRGKTDKATIKEIQNAKLDFTRKEFKLVPPEAIELCSKMLEKDPRNRIKLKMALNHSFFKEELLRTVEIHKSDIDEIIMNLNRFKHANAF